MKKKEHYILIYAPTSRGGLAEHIHYQATNLQKLGKNVLVLCTPDFLDKRPVTYELKKSLISAGNQSSSKLLKKVLLLFSILYNQYYSAFFVFFTRPSFILLESFTEYFSPIWIWPHIICNKVLRYKYIANIHDPVRDYVLGPLWWHRLSIALAYIPIGYGLIHRRLSVPSPVPEHVKIAEVPVGVYDVMPSTINPEQIKATWGFPDTAQVFLSFGYIRDNKNIDLFLRAMVKNKNVYLAVLGSAASSKGKNLDWYKSLSVELGLGNRTFFSDEFIPEQKIDSIFACADYVLLSYAASFVSQSGVLNIAAKFRKPVLASSGASPLQDTVKGYNIGVFVAPDSVAALETGIEALLNKSYMTPDWDGFLQYASWKTNVTGLLKLMDDNK